MTRSDDAAPHVRIDVPHATDAVPGPRPRIGWLLPGPAVPDVPAFAHWRLTREDRTREHAVLSGHDRGGASWPFAPLVPRQRVELEVRVSRETADASGVARGADAADTQDDAAWGPWSEPRRVWAGFLAEGEWTAASLTASAPEHRAQPVVLRRTLTVRGDLVRATLYASAVGVYQASIGLADVDDQVMKPGWTSTRRAIHESTDVTALLAPGRHALTVRLAGGWGTELFGWTPDDPRALPQPVFAAQLVLEYADGARETVVTDAQWRWAPGPITASGLYAGEDYDARRALRDAAGREPSHPDFDDSTWAAAATAPQEIPAPEARTSPVVRRIEELAVREVIMSPSGRTILDFGQNLVGRVRLTVRGEAGTTVTLRHAEVLENGELGTRPLRQAAQTDRYTLAGAGDEVWEPEFTFHGFRYVEVDGWPGTLDPSGFTAVVIHSDMARTGTFETSHPLVQKLHDNVVWGLRGNFLYLPTDCPQRDERLGWTGDIQVFAPTASFLYDVRGFLDSWLVDLALDQLSDGVVPFVIPNVFGTTRPAAAWGDAATVVPSVLYERFADEAVLARQLPSMRAWADRLEQLADERHLWEGMFQFGDWLDPDAPPNQAERAKVDPDIVASAYLFRSLALVARAAEIVGDHALAGDYRERAESVRAAFVHEYVTPAYRMMSDAPTAYALAIVFDLVTDAEGRAALGRRLAELCRRGAYRISTGFVGTPIIADALTSTGQVEAAGRLLLATDCPSWLYPVTMGATTVWERWDAMLPDGSINPGEMTSFNHYALGAIADWLHRVVAGLAPAAPGYRRVRLQPTPIAGLDDARAGLDTAYGRVSIGWRRRLGGSIAVTAEIPSGVVADVQLPGHESSEATAGVHEWTFDVPPVPPAHALDLTSTLAEVADDLEAYDLVMRAFDEAWRPAADMVRSLVRWSPTRPLRDLIEQFYGPEVVERIARDLDELAARRTDASPARQLSLGGLVNPGAVRR